MNLYQMIFKRRSIRKFKYEAVPEQLLKDILAFAGCVATLCPEISIKMEIKENICPVYWKNVEENILEKYFFI